MNETDITIYQLNLMKHAIGFKRDKVKRGKYIAWRNYFCSYEPCEPWDKLVSLGMAVKSTQEKSGCFDSAVYYSVTHEGIEVLSDVLEVQIVEDKE